MLKKENKNVKDLLSSNEIEIFRNGELPNYVNPFWEQWKRGIKTKRSNPFRTTIVIELDVKRYPDISEERRLRLRAFPTMESIFWKISKGLNRNKTFTQIQDSFTKQETELIYYLEFRRHKILDIEKDPEFTELFK